jgi:hypothetical protein
VGAEVIKAIPVHCQTRIGRDFQFTANIPLDVHLPGANHCRIFELFDAAQNCARPIAPAEASAQAGVRVDGLADFDGVRVHLDGQVHLVGHGTGRATWFSWPKPVQP